MERFLQIVFVLLAGISVAVADALIKKVAVTNDNFWSAIRHPLMIPIVLLYIAQIVLFTYVFVKKWELGVVGILQMAVYALVVIGSGVFLFHEKLTPVQTIGVAFAITGAILLNL